MMGIIDGTGAWFDDDDRNWMPWNWGDKSEGYRSAFRNSYCRQTADALQRVGQPVLYQRGPSALGMETGPYARRIIDWLKREHAARPKEPVFLMGYSRGASAVVTAASFLRREAPTLRVTAMFLFDAVDRSVFTDSEKVPANVEHCYHAVRDYSAITWLIGRHRHNRWYFNSDALEAEAGVDLKLINPAVRASHGAMGGTPWADDRRDPSGLVRVANWMNPHLLAHGLPRALDPARCYPEGSPMDRRVERLIQPRQTGGMRSDSLGGLQNRLRSGR